MISIFSFLLVKNDRSLANRFNQTLLVALKFQSNMHFIAGQFSYNNYLWNSKFYYPLLYIFFNCFKLSSFGRLILNLRKNFYQPLKKTLKMPVLSIKILATKWAEEFPKTYHPTTNKQETAILAGGAAVFIRAVYCICMSK